VHNNAVPGQHTCRQIPRSPFSCKRSPPNSHSVSDGHTGLPISRQLESGAASVGLYVWSYGESLSWAVF